MCSDGVAVLSSFQQVALPQLSGIQDSDQKRLSAKDQGTFSASSMVSHIDIE